jgi:hypothetical protein
MWGQNGRLGGIPGNKPVNPESKDCQPGDLGQDENQHVLEGLVLFHRDQRILQYFYKRFE